MIDSIRKLFVVVVTVILLSLQGESSPFTDEMQRKIDAIKAKQAEQDRQRQAFVAQKNLVDKANQCLWTSRAMAGSPEEIKQELDNVESAIRDIRDLRGQQLDNIQWAEVDRRLERIKYGRSSVAYSPARRKHTLHALEIQIMGLEYRRQVLRDLQNGTRTKTTRVKKNLPCDSICGYAFGQSYAQDGLVADIQLKKPFRHLKSIRLSHDSERHLISAELRGELPTSDEDFVIDELIKTIMVFEDQYGIVFPWFSNGLTTSVTKNGRCFTISAEGQHLRCKVCVAAPEKQSSTQREDVIPEGVGSDVL